MKICDKCHYEPVDSFNPGFGEAIPWPVDRMHRPDCEYIVGTPEQQAQSKSILAAMEQEKAAKQIKLKEEAREAYLEKLFPAFSYIGTGENDSCKGCGATVAFFAMRDHLGFHERLDRIEQMANSADSYWRPIG